METKYEASMARTLRAEQHQNTQDHHDTCEDTNERVQRTVTLKQFVFGLLLMWVVCTFIGKATSGRYWFESDREVRRLSDENNRLDNELNMVRHKLGFRNETILVYRGILEDRPELLELSKIENKNRSEQFEFINWSFPDKAVHFMYQVQSYECLKWVRRQPKWYSCLSSKSYELIMEHTDGPVAGAAQNRDDQ
tara:strand:+ start:410 stop:991 length:582 start_codon:yes stop_codon:yes gene_type:complete